MDGDGARGGLEMARGSFARIEDGRGVRLYVREGELWITQEGDRRDYYVGAGESFQLDRDGVALASALRPSSVDLVFERAPAIAA